MIETRRTTGAGLRGAGHRLRVGTGPLSGMDPGHLVVRRGVRAILAGTALAGLLAATACAVASVSGWLVPAYLLLVVVILTAPRGPRRSPAPGTTTNDAGPGLAEPGRVLGGGQADGTGLSESRTDALPEPTTPASSDDDGPANLRLDPAATATPRPRKSRARSRKAAKTAEPAPDSAPVTWVRVGPGQFVRSDTLPQGHTPVEDSSPAEVQPPVEAPAPAEAPPPAEEDSFPEAPPPVEAPASAEVQPAVEENTSPEAPPPVEQPCSAEVELAVEEPSAVEAPAIVVQGDPATDASEPAMAEPAAQSEAHPVVDDSEAGVPASEDPAAVVQPETVAPDATAVPTPESDASEVVPSADVPATEPTGPEVVPDHDPDAEEYGIAPSAFDDPVREPRADDGRRTFRLPRGLVDRRLATRWARPAPSRRATRGPGRPRVAVRGRSSRESHRGGAARRAPGRTDDVRHTWRARSPP